ALRTLAVTVVVGGVLVGLSFAALIPGVLQLVGAHHYTVEDVEELRELSQRSSVYFADGTFMGSLGTENRVLARYDEIPDVIKNAVIAIEDRTFWTNPGIDIG